MDIPLDVFYAMFRHFEYRYKSSFLYRNFNSGPVINTDFLKSNLSRLFEAIREAEKI